LIGAQHRQVEQNGSGHDGHFGYANVEAMATLLQPAHHAIGGGQAIGAAAADQDGVDMLDGTGGGKQLRFARARRAAAHVHAGDRALRTQHHCAAGPAFQVCPVSDAQARDCSERAVFSGHDAGRAR
jgi:hypothetical protein